MRSITRVYTHSSVTYAFVHSTLTDTHMHAYFTATHSHSYVLILLTDTHGGHELLLPLGRICLGTEVG